MAAGSPGSWPPSPVTAPTRLGRAAAPARYGEGTVLQRRPAAGCCGDQPRGRAPGGRDRRPAPPLSLDHVSGPCLRRHRPTAAGRHRHHERGSVAGTAQVVRRGSGSRHRPRRRPLNAPEPPPPPGPWAAASASARRPRTCRPQVVTGTFTSSAPPDSSDLARLEPSARVCGRHAITLQPHERRRAARRGTSDDQRRTRTRGPHHRVVSLGSRATTVLQVPRAARPTPPAATRRPQFRVRPPTPKVKAARRLPRPSASADGSRRPGAGSKYVTLAGAVACAVALGDRRLHQEGRQEGRRRARSRSSTRPPSTSTAPR